MVWLGRREVESRWAACHLSVPCQPVSRSCTMYEKDVHLQLRVGRVFCWEFLTANNLLEAQVETNKTTGTVVLFVSTGASPCHSSIVLSCISLLLFNSVIESNWLLRICANSRTKREKSCWKLAMGTFQCNLCCEFKVQCKHKQKHY